MPFIESISRSSRHVRDKSREFFGRNKTNRKLSERAQGKQESDTPPPLLDEEFESIRNPTPPPFEPPAGRRTPEQPHTPAPPAYNEASIPAPQTASPTSILKPIRKPRKELPLQDIRTKPTATNEDASKGKDPVESVTQRVPTPEKDPAWEGSLNHHASQLRVLADRVEQINEWLELDWIVEMRMTKDIVDNYRPECHRSSKVGFKDNTDAGQSPTLSIVPSLPDPTSPHQALVDYHGTKITEAEVEMYRQEKMDKVEKNQDIKEMRGRIDRLISLKNHYGPVIKRHINEHRRLARLLGMTDDSWSEPISHVREEHWGVNGRTWQKNRGRLPSNREWNDLMSFNPRGIKEVYTEPPRHRNLTISLHSRDDSGIGWNKDTV